MSSASLIAVFLASAPAFALQSLDEFLASAKTNNFDQREAKETTAQREAEADQATSRLFPTLSARASVTHNQFEATAEFPNLPPAPPGTTLVTITPRDQLDATFVASLPIIDVGSWMRVGASGATSDAAKLRAKATTTDVEKTVTRQYFQVLATEASVVATKKAEAVAEESQKIFNARKEAGAASDLEVERARAAVERSKQAVAGAEQARNVARRQLATLTGLEPSEGAGTLPDDKLEDAPALAALEPSVESLPAVQAAQAEAKAADRSATAAWAAFAPTVTASATERLTNATGFSGQVGAYALALTAQLTIDPSTFFAAKALESSRGAASVRVERSVRAAKDALYSDTEEVKAQIAKVKAAAAELDASAKAAKLARDRLQAGSATQLDVQQADRDVFNADLARIQAQADLAYARALVRVDSGAGKLAK